MNVLFTIIKINSFNSILIFKFYFQKSINHFIIDCHFWKSVNKKRLTI
jgi:hypothetical protein